MPITTNPTDITVLVPQVVQGANKLHIDDFHISAAGEKSSPDNHPSVDIVLCRYAEAQDGTRTYAEGTERKHTRDAYAVATVLPSGAAFMQMLFTVVQEWDAEETRRKAVMDSTQAAADAALATLQQVENEDPIDNNALTAAQTAYQKALQDANTARLAWVDLANPPLQ